jgi:hypothetical protein
MNAHEPPAPRASTTTPRPAMDGDYLSGSYYPPHGPALG